MYELTADVTTLAGRIRPWKALQALLKFIRDPDDTPQVFRIVRALDGDSAEQSFRRFCATRTGRALLARESTLAQVLANRPALRQLDEQSLGAAYLRFVEAERISVEGLEQAAYEGGIHGRKLEPARNRYRARLHAMHDLLHVVTGYGTDEFGEACLLAFTYAQNGSRGLLPIVHGLALRLRLRYPKLKIGVTIREAFRVGAEAEWLTAQDWEALLSRPLAEVRDTLGVLAPARYLAQRDLSCKLDARRLRRLQSQ